ncbi:MAG: hypothetical protein RL226_1214 [Bacteroidota bacterium]
MVINYYEPAGESDQDRLQQLIADAINFYIDRAVIISTDRLKLLKSADAMHKELGQIVEDALEYYNYRDVTSFKGFSNEIKKSLIELDGFLLNDPAWNPDLKGSKLADARFFLIESKLNDLKAELKKEIGIYTTSNLMVQVGSSTQQLEENQAALLDEVRNIRKDSPLELLDIAFSDATLNLLAGDDEFVLAPYENTETDLASKILAMLNENNNRLDQLQKEVNDLKSRAYKPNDEVQDQLNDLKEMLTSLVASGAAGFTPVVSNLPDAFDVRFSTGSVALNIDAKMQLNELVEIMAVNPKLRVILTGFADTSGSRELNLKLSRDRANSVRKYLLTAGVEHYRILTNFFGEERANGTDEVDRRVEVEFLP